MGLAVHIAIMRVVRLIENVNSDCHIDGGLLRRLSVVESQSWMELSKN